MILTNMGVVAMVSNAVAVDVLSTDIVEVKSNCKLATSSLMI